MGSFPLDYCYIIHEIKADDMVLFNAPLHFPSGREWMWDYCVYLGPFTDSAGDNFDLGIHLGGALDISTAIVFGNEPGDYYSGPIDSIKRECYVETKRRALELNLI